MRSKWFDWHSTGGTTGKCSDAEASKPTKLSSEGFVGRGLAGFPASRDSSDQSVRVNESQPTCLQPPANRAIMPPSSYTRGDSPTTPGQGNFVPGTSISLPPGVRLIKYSPSQPAPRGLFGRRVIDFDKFVRTQLADLDARLNHPVQIRGGGSVFGILANLADVGLELAISRPEELPSGGRPSVVRENGEPASETDKTGGAAQ
jgi:hypothetical protein